MKNIFTHHPHKVGETYLEHLRIAIAFGGKMLLAGFACLAHAIFPFLFQKTASNIMIKLMLHFVERMPNVEKRVLVMAKLIQSKAENSNEENLLKEIL